MKFDTLTYKSRDTFNNPGLLCEGLLFYQKTNLIIDPGSFPEALRYCGYDNLIELIKSGELNISFLSQSLGAGNVADNKFIISVLTNVTQNKNAILKEKVKDVYGKGIQSANMTTHLSKLIKEEKYSREFSRLAGKEVENGENLKTAISILSNGEILEKDVKLNIERIGKSLYNIESNIDNSLIQSAALFMNTGTSELHLAESNNSSIVTNFEVSDYAQNKMKKIIQRRLQDESEIDVFHEKVLPEYYDLKGTINSGSQDFNGYMEVWRAARKFKHWLNEEEPNTELLTAYIRKVGESSWLGKTTPQQLRWLAFTGLGFLMGDISGTFVGPAAAKAVETLAPVAVDYFDDLILNRFLNNWKPNIYVDGHYKEFLRPIIEQ